MDYFCQAPLGQTPEPCFACTVVNCRGSLIFSRDVSCGSPGANGGTRMPPGACVHLTLVSLTASLPWWQTRAGTVMGESGHLVAHSWTVYLATDVVEDRGAHHLA